jgi:hypothetical protein
LPSPQTTRGSAISHSSNKQRNTTDARCGLSSNVGKKNQEKLLKRGQQVDQASSEEHKEKKAKQHSSPRGAAHKRPTYSQISTTLPKNAAPGSCACHLPVCAVHPGRSQTVPESDIGLPGRRSKRGTVPWVPVLDKPLLVALRTAAQLSSGSQDCGSGE